LSNTIFFYIPEDMVKDGNIVCNLPSYDQEISKEDNIEDFIAKGIIWESFLIAIANNVSPFIAFLLDSLGRKDPKWYEELCYFYKSDQSS